VSRIKRRIVRRIVDGPPEPMTDEELLNHGLFVERSHVNGDVDVHAARRKDVSRSGHRWQGEKVRGNVVNDALFPATPEG
jgi:hypothetical protein